MKVDTKKRVHTEPALKVKSPSKKLFNLSARQEYHQGEKRVPLLSFLNYQIISYFQNEVKDFQQKIKRICLRLPFAYCTSFSKIE